MSTGLEIPIPLYGLVRFGVVLPGFVGVLLVYPCIYGPILTRPVTIAVTKSRALTYPRPDAAKSEERGTIDFSDRIGLVAWCLGRFSMFDKLKALGGPEID
jgi:hypothetical protein